MHCLSVLQRSLHGKLQCVARHTAPVAGPCQADTRSFSCREGRAEPWAARAPRGSGKAPARWGSSVLLGPSLALACGEPRGRRGGPGPGGGGGAGGAPEPTSCTPTRGAFSPRSRSVASSEPPPPASPPLRILTEAGVQRSGPWRLSPSPVVFSLSTTAIAVCIELDNLGIFLHGIHIIDVTKNQSIKGTKYMVAEGY